MSQKEKAEQTDNTIKNLRETKEDIRLEMMDEIQNCTSVRAECLLVTNYVESILKDIMVVMTVSEKSRKIPRLVIVEILKDKKLLTPEMATDIKKMFNIRDFFGHNLKLVDAEMKCVSEIQGMNIPKSLRIQQSNWDNIDLTGKITSIALVMLNDLDTIFENISVGID